MFLCTASMSSFHVPSLAVTLRENAKAKDVLPFPEWMLSCNRENEAEMCLVFYFLRKGEWRVSQFTAMEKRNPSDKRFIAERTFELDHLDKPQLHERLCFTAVDAEALESFWKTPVRSIHAKLCNKSETKMFRLVSQSCCSRKASSLKKYVILCI